MEGVSPTLQLLLICKRYLSAQRSLREAIYIFIQENKSPFAQDVEKWLIFLEQGRSLDREKHSHSNIYRQQLLDILAKGLKGHSILPVLEQFEEEIVEKSFHEVEEFAARLPFQMLIPLLFFQFPAFIMLILGPILKKFLEV